jgi:hypothetical protein
MAPITIEVYQGAVRTWSKTFASEPTVQNVIAAIQGEPKSFKGNPECCDFKTSVDGAVLAAEFVISTSCKLWSKKKKDSSSSSAGTAVATKPSTKKPSVKEGYEASVELPTMSLVLNGRGVSLVFPSADAATEFAVQTCAPHGIDLKKVISDQEKEKKKKEIELLKEQLALLESETADVAVSGDEREGSGTDADESISAAAAVAKSKNTKKK